MSYYVQNGIYKLGFELSKLERQILRDMEDHLIYNNFNYLSVPSTITIDTFIKQQIKSQTFKYEHNSVLGGSAEQGILEYFSNKHVKPQKIYSKNSCFRVEDEYIDLLRVKEFYKIEQFIFCEEKDAEDMFEHALLNGIWLLEQYNLKYREVDVTKLDPGYHKKKIDLEVYTKKYGWIETHSCTYFGEEQTKRYNITGATHTISNTGVATPRILIPLIERMV